MIAVVQGGVMHIHPTAVVSPRAELASGVRIGPYSVVGDDVAIGRDTILESHVIIEGHTRIGERNRLYPFVTIGTPPQDIGYRGEDTRVVVGDDNIIREYATIHRATSKQDWTTVLGNRNYIMAYAHIAHDCRLGNGIILANVATLGGHTVIGNHANIGGLVATHQFVRIGDYAFIGGKSGISQDVPPFMMAAGPRARLYGVNQKGLKRLAFSDETINGLKKAYQILWRDKGSLREGMERVRREVASSPELDILLEFIVASERGVIR